VNDAFRAERADRSSSFERPISASDALPLFTPEGEKAWAEGWDPEYVFPPDGHFAVGMVFRTTIGDEDTIWTVTRYEPAAGLVEYVRCTPSSRIAVVSVNCTPLGAARCRVTVRYVFTGLTPAGNAWIRAMDEERYGQFIASWRSEIDASESGLRAS
jgi:hypothetical protein